MPQEMRTVEFTIMGQKRALEVRKIPLSKFKLDPQNVRFKHLEKSLSDPDMEEEIWKENETKYLKEQILAERGLIEPPLVDQSLIVKEGNRRIVCLRKLSKLAHKGKLPGVPSDLFDNVECYVLPPDISGREIAVYLAIQHVSGKAEWAAVNKARHVFELNDVYGLPYEDIAKHIGMSKATVTRMINAMKATYKYHEKIPSDDAWINKYTYFHELYGRRALKDWLAKESSNLDKYMEWISKGKFKEHRQVRYLPDVVNDDDALVKLEKANMDEVLKILEQKRPELVSDTFRLIKHAISAINQIPRHEFITLCKDKARRKMLEDLGEAVKGLLEDAEKLSKASS